MHAIAGGLARAAPFPPPLLKTTAFNLILLLIKVCGIATVPHSTPTRIAYNVIGFLGTEKALKMFV